MKYTVKKGDTLTAIARNHNTTVAALVAANGIANPNLILVGQVLEIPDSNPEPQPEPKPDNNKLYNAFITCMDAIEQLPEFQQLEKMLYG